MKSNEHYEHCAGCDLRMANEVKLSKTREERDSLREEVNGLWSLLISKGLHFRYQRELEQIAEKAAKVSTSGGE